MSGSGATWVVVLAGGEGERMRPATIDVDGAQVPKQFWRVGGGRTLLGSAIARAERIAPAERVLVAVQRKHRPFWEAELSGRAEGTTLVEPRPSGTAGAVALALAHVLARDPDATLLVLPADQVVGDERGFEEVLRAAAQLATAEGYLALVGIPPDGTPQCDWLLAAAGTDCVRPLAAVASRREAVHAYTLGSGALWNTHVLAARARMLAKRFEQLAPSLLAMALLRGDGRLAPACNLDAGLGFGLRPEQLDLYVHIVAAHPREARVLVAPRRGCCRLTTTAQMDQYLSSAPLRLGPQERGGPYLDLADRRRAQLAAKATNTAA